MIMTLLHGPVVTIWSAYICYYYGIVYNRDKSDPRYLYVAEVNPHLYPFSILLAISSMTPLWASSGATMIIL